MLALVGVALVFLMTGGLLLPGIDQHFNRILLEGDTGGPSMARYPNAPPLTRDSSASVLTSPRFSSRSQLHFPGRRNVYGEIVGDFDGDGFDDILWFGRPNRREIAFRKVRAVGNVTRVRVWGLRMLTDDDGLGGRRFLVSGSSPWKWPARADVLSTPPTRSLDVYVRVLDDVDDDGYPDVLWYESSRRWHHRTFGYTTSSFRVPTGIWIAVRGRLHDRSGRETLLYSADGRGSSAVVVTETAGVKGRSW
ncbi:MAG: hypothetical protein M3198_14540 [Actinomycetota bacterium]|nr:hypothetical protein [Actinomycetota bacterium]